MLLARDCRGPLIGCVPSIHPALLVHERATALNQEVAYWAPGLPLRFSFLCSHAKQAKTRRCAQTLAFLPMQMQITGEKGGLADAHVQMRAETQGCTTEGVRRRPRCSVRLTLL